MKHHIRIISFSTIILLAIVSLPAFAADEGGPTAAEYGVVLNLSGKQRMLSQKMSKEVLLIAVDCDKAKNIENLKATAALFDRTLIGLKDGDEGLGLPPTVSKRITRQLGKTTELWTPFHAKIEEILVNGEVSPEDVQAIADSNLPLLKEMNRCVKLYERDASKQGLESDPGLAVTINLAGKQRMLTQKMSKEFLLTAYGYDADANRLNLRETATLFGRTLKGLQDGDETLDLPGTTQEEILTQLGTVETLWVEFQPLVEAGATNTEISSDDVQLLADKNIPLLKEMNKAVKLYEQEASK